MQHLFLSSSSQGSTSLRRFKDRGPKTKLCYGPHLSLSLSHLLVLIPTTRQPKSPQCFDKHTKSSWGLKYENMYSKFILCWFVLWLSSSILDAQPHEGHSAKIFLKQVPLKGPGLFFSLHTTCIPTLLKENGIYPVQKRVMMSMYIPLYGVFSWLGHAMPHLPSSVRFPKNYVGRGSVQSCKGD